MTQQFFNLSVPGDLTSLETIAEFVTEAAQRAGLDAQEIFGVQMATDEACTNVIEHAYAGTSGDIHLTCQVEPGELVITIRDHGRPFDPESVPLPNLNGALQDRRVGGLGLYFMRKLMDEVHFSFDPTGGNQVIMVKRAAHEPPRSTEPTFVVVRPRGRLEAASAPTLQARLAELLAQGQTRIVVDMADVTYTSSSGLKVLLSALRQARRQRGELVLSNVQPKVISILEMVGFDRVFPIAQDLHTASQFLQ